MRHLQPSYEWALFPYLHQVHAHKPQEVPVECQLLEVLAQGDATHILAAYKQLFFTQATGQRGIKNSLGWARAIPHPRQPSISQEPQHGSQAQKSAGHSPAIHSHGWAPRLPAGCLNPPPQQPCSPHKAQPGASGQCQAEGAEGRKVLFVPEGVGGKDRQGAGCTEEGAVEVEVGAVVG